MINRLFIFLLGLSCVLTFQATQTDIISSPLFSLAPPLKEVSEKQNVSKDFLINSSTNLLMSNYLSSLNWLDDDQIVYDNQGNIETFNTVNNQHTIIAEGSHPRVSPNGQWIVFFSQKNEGNQVWLMKSDGSQQRQLTHIKEGFLGVYGYHYGIVWSADSFQIAFYINPVNSEDLSSITSPPSPSTIHIVHINANSSRKIYSDAGLLGDLSWYPDGSKLLMTKLQIGLFFQRDNDISLIQSVKVADGSAMILKQFNGLQQGLQPKLSSDGLLISFLYNAESDLYNWMLSLGIIQSESTTNSFPIKQLTFDIKLVTSQWSKNDKNIYVLRNYGAYDQIYTVDEKTGGITQITHGPLNIMNFAVSPSGSKIVWKGMDAHGFSVFRVSATDGTDIKDLMIESPSKEKIALSEVREIEWETIDYPAKMRGLLFLPNKYQKGKRYPLIVDIHGGGPGASIYLFGGILNDSPLEWQIWTAKGYAVFVPEFRSSGAFGYLAIQRDELENHDIINCDTVDIIAGVDELVRRGIVDPEKIAAIGHSAGGRRANWLTVSSNKFKAIVSKEGWADEWIDGMNSPITWEYFGGSPQKVPENYQKNSALFHAKKGSTPTLFLMGNPKLGGADRNNTVYQLYKALQENDVETEYIQYMDEGHNFTLPKNRKDALDRTIDWIDRHLET